MISRLTILFILIADFLFVHGQINSTFLNHLFKNGLRREALHYITLNSGKDSLPYYQAKFAVSFKVDSLLESLVLETKLEGIEDTALQKKISIRAFGFSEGAKEKWFREQPAHELKEVFLASVNPLSHGSDLSMNDYSKAYRNYCRAFSKKPFSAAVLSAIIPGAGKLYIGRPRSFFGTFIITNLMIAQSVESVNRLGPRNVFSVLNVSAAAMFYLANVYGSYNDCRVNKKLHKQAFLIEATDFYSNNNL